MTKAISFTPNGRKPEHANAELVLAGRGDGVPGSGVLEPGDDDEHDDEQKQREPVQVAGVDHSDEEVGDVRGVQSQTLFAAGHAGVAPHQDVAGLGEREGDHRERDAGHPQAQRAEQVGSHDDDREGEPEGGNERELGLLQHDAEPVRAEREVQGVPKRQHPRRAEQQVVAERE